MNNDLTDIVIVLDGSKSMKDLLPETVSGVNGLIEDQANQPGDCRITLVQFRGGESYKVIINQQYAEDCPRVTEANYECKGLTPLYECCCIAIDRLGQRLSETPEHMRPGKVLVVITTDGEENASAHPYNDPAELRRRIEHQEQVYNWGFMFLGKDIRSDLEAGKIGVDTQNAADYNSPVKAFDVVSKKAASYRRSGDKTQLHFTDAERAAM